MLYVDGVNYYKISEVAKKINVHPNTLRLWDRCSDELEAMNKPRLIPVSYKYGEKGIRFWNDKDIVKILEYKDTAKYGELAYLTRANRGKTSSHLLSIKNKGDYESKFDFKGFLLKYNYKNIAINSDVENEKVVIFADKRIFYVPFTLLDDGDEGVVERHLKSEIFKSRES